MPVQPFIALDTSPAATVTEPRSRRFTSFLPPLALIGLVLLLWLPVGFNIPLEGDGWSVVGLLPRGAETVVNFNMNVPTRIFTFVPWMMGYYLSRDTFIGLNVVMACMFAVRGLAVYGILRRLMPNIPAFAFLTAALVIVYAADDDVFYSGALNVHTALTSYFAAAYLLITYWQKPRWYTLIGMFAGLIFCLGLYEVSFPWIVFTPLLLLALEKRISRRLIIVSALWYIIPAIWGGIYAYNLFNDTSSYHNRLLQSTLTTELLFERLGKTYERSLFTGFNVQTLTPLFFVAAGTCALVAFWSARPIPAKRRIGFGWIFVVLAAFVAIFLGIAMSLPTGLFNYLMWWRLYYHTGVAGAITAAAFVYFVAQLLGGKYGEYLFIAAASVLIGLATTHTLEQHNATYQRAAAQRDILAAVVVAVPQPAPNSIIVVIDSTPTREMMRFASNYIFELATSTVYNMPLLPARMCLDDAQSTNPVGSCTFTDAGVKVSGIWGGVETYPYDRAIVLQFTESGIHLLDPIPDRYLNGVDTAGYNPSALIGSELPSRLYTMLEYEQP